jgi:hypothetical protein
MGGATINTTVLDVVHNDENHETRIDVLGKIGYGIGGDSIDFCLAKIILELRDEFTQLSSFDIDSHKHKLSALARHIKEEPIYENFNNDKVDYLITPAQLTRVINRILEPNPRINIADNNKTHNKYFKKDNSGRYQLFDHELFSKWIYNNVRDAVIDVLDLSGKRNIDTVIFSGRSTHFPLIRDTVMRVFNERRFTGHNIILGLEESKTAVAAGACWFGINKSSISRNNLKTYVSYGVLETFGPDQTNIEFHQLIPRGSFYHSENRSMGSVDRDKRLVSEFKNDANRANFYQVMGEKAREILSQGQKHKFSQIASLGVEKISKRVKITVSEDDYVKCLVELDNDQEISDNGVIPEQDVTMANEEHYTWMLDLD